MRKKKLIKAVFKYSSCIRVILLTSKTTNGFYKTNVVSRYKASKGDSFKILNCCIAVVALKSPEKKKRKLNCKNTKAEMHVKKKQHNFKQI